MQSFDELFRTATGHAPYGYQARIARDGLPDVVNAPAGTGKTAVILAWLWRRLYGPDPGGTPRRLVYALPQRSLVDQVSGEARKWLDHLGLTEEVALHVVMGARGETQGDWRADMHKPAIVVGTADALVSKALVRAYGVGRAMYPIDFALVTNGAHWLVDEIQLCPESTTTLRQLARFAARIGTAEPFGLTCMSATADDTPPGTADNPSAGVAVKIRPEERQGELAVRLGASRTVRRMNADASHPRVLAARVRELHRPGTLTLVVANTVPAARDVYKQLRGGTVDCTLLHSRFRGIERAGRMAELMTRPEDAIVVATQVIEAGIDLSAAVLVTEAAPWRSLAQRIGRCNRTGKVADAEVWWLPPARPLPYEQEDIDAAVAELAELDGTAVTGEDLLERRVFHAQDQVAVLRRTDFLALFDTSPDLSGNDADIAPYVRDAEDLDAEVAWATWTASADGAPDPEVRPPAAEYRCRVSIGEAVKLAKDRAVWRFDQVAGKWTRVTAQLQSRPRPGEVLLVNAADGGYDPETGFDPSARGPVAGSPELLTPAEWTERAAAGEDAFAADTASVAPRRWQSLDEHSGQVRDQAAALVKVLAPDLPAGTGDSTVLAGYLHDIGKAHTTWQDALCALAEEDERDKVAAGRPWAKSGGKGGALEFAGGVPFRHELASLLLADGPLRGLLKNAPDPDLAEFLILAHHGKLRVQVRDPGDLGLEQGAQSQVPSILGQPATTLSVELDRFQPGGNRSWTRTVLGLRDKYGPFTLAYLETLVRMADWRASGGRELPE